MKKRYVLLSVLASKALPDGTVVTAILYSKNSVLLMHQIVRDVSLHVPACAPIWNKEWLRDNHEVTANVSMQSIKVQLISLADFEAAQDSYEQYMNRETAQISNTPQLEDKR